MANAVKFKQKVQEQPGEVARLKVVQGPDSGCVFVLKAPRATMGRGDENDIVFSDLRASRRHAEIFIDSRGTWGLKDLGSSNGILFDGQVIREGTVKGGDKFTLGETTLEFQPTRAVQAVAAPAASKGLMQSLTPTLAGLGGGAAPAAAAAPAGIAGIGGLQGQAAQGMNPRMLIYVALIAALFFLPDEETPAPKKDVKKKESARRDLASYLPEYDAARTGPAEMFFREGFREYREKNFLRAKTQFETVLQVAPGHRLATIYLRNCEKAIEEEVDDHLAQGKQDVKIGKLKSARSHYEAVMRLLHRDPNHASFVEAKEAIVDVDQALKGVAKQ